MESHKPFWAFPQVCMCYWVRSLQSSDPDSSQSAGFRASDPCVQCWADAGMKLRWWDAWSTCKLTVHLIWSVSRCSRRVRHFLHTPWWGRDAWMFRLSRRAGWCWDAWLILGCGSLGKPSLRLRRRWSSPSPRSWWQLFNRWVCVCRVWPCRKCPLR